MKTKRKSSFVDLVTERNGERATDENAPEQKQQTLSLTSSGGLTKQKRKINELNENVHFSTRNERATKKSVDGERKTDEEKCAGRNVA